REDSQDVREDSRDVREDSLYVRLSSKTVKKKYLKKESVYFIPFWLVLIIVRIPAPAQAICMSVCSNPVIFAHRKSCLPALA
ncbi:MAG: hypothetical protein SPL69_05145, partial [Succinivibrionaceae bacterium]|nr:hypothetical protein [Succinivibrionaceae bacterium]